MHTVHFGGPVFLQDVAGLVDVHDEPRGQTLTPADLSFVLSLEARSAIGTLISSSSLSFDVHDEPQGTHLNTGVLVV